MHKLLLLATMVRPTEEDVRERLMPFCVYQKSNSSHVVYEDHHDEIVRNWREGTERYVVMGDGTMRLPTGEVEASRAPNRRDIPIRKLYTLAEYAESVWQARDVDGRWCCPVAAAPRWHWHRIGGRWSGLLDISYDPRTDPANYGLCPCTGINQFGVATAVGTSRWPVPLAPDSVSASDCKTCNGTGKSLLWPSLWVPHEGSQRQLNDVDLTSPVFHSWLYGTSLLDLNGEWIEYHEDKRFNVLNRLKEMPPETWLTVIDYQI